MYADDLLQTPLDQAQIDFENDGGETYICGNPPYAGSAKQTEKQKNDVRHTFETLTTTWRSLDLVACWFKLAADYFRHAKGAYAFVSTNSICQGEQVPILWPLIYQNKMDIVFAHTSFKWANLASHNAGVTVIIVGVSSHRPKSKWLFSTDDEGSVSAREVDEINAYLIAGKRLIVEAQTRAVDDRAYMIRGNMPTDGGHLLLTEGEKASLLRDHPSAMPFVRSFVGAQELINGISRNCIWIEDDELENANAIPALRERIEKVRKARLESKAATTRDYARYPHKFRQIQGICSASCIVVPRVSSENRQYLPVGYYDSTTIVGDRNFAMCDAALWNLALIASRLHWVWIGAVCVRMRTDFSYSNTLGWNTFPVPPLTEKNRADLTRCAEDILLVREAHFPSTIADLYNPEHMPSDLREAHERNDEVLERVYIGRRFKNDTERLEKLFDLYIRMITSKARGAA